MSFLLPASFPKCFLSLSLMPFKKFWLTYFKEPLLIICSRRKRASQAGSLTQQISVPGVLPSGCAEGCCILLLCNWPALTAALPPWLQQGLILRDSASMRLWFYFCPTAEVKLTTNNSIPSGDIVSVTCLFMDIRQCHDFFLSPIKNYTTFLRIFGFLIYFYYI